LHAVRFILLENNITDNDKPAFGVGANPYLLLLGFVLKHTQNIRRQGVCSRRSNAPRLSVRSERQ